MLGQGVVDALVIQDEGRYANQCKIRPMSSGRSRRSLKLRGLYNMPVFINVEGTKAVSNQ